MKYFLLLICLLFSSVAFGQIDIPFWEPHPLEDMRVTVKCKIVTEPFIIKNGVESDVQELYVRHYSQNYFIKFCDSKLKEATLRKYLNKRCTLDIEVKNGFWDMCSLEEQQSRMGIYVIVYGVKK